MFFLSSVGVVMFFSGVLRQFISVAYPCNARKGSCMRKRMGMKSSSNKLLLSISLLILNLRE